MISYSLLIEIGIGAHSIQSASGYGQQQHQPPQMQQHQGMHGGGGYGGGYGGGHGGRGPMRNEGEPSRSLWVGNVSPEASEHELQDIFQQFGPVDAVKVLRPLAHPIVLDPTFVFNA